MSTGPGQERCLSPKFTIKFCTLGLLLLVSGSRVEATPTNHALRSKIQLFTHQLMESSPTAGLSMSVRWGGNQIIEEAFGYANIEAEAKATPATIYEIASISKEFTATAVMRLAEREELSLDDDIRKYININTGSHLIKIRHLLEHSSGLASFTEFPEIKRCTAGEWRTPADIIRAIGQRPLIFEPGTKYSYTNTGFFLLALIVEKVSGQKFEDYVKQEVIARAGLKETFYCDGERLTLRRAMPYKLRSASEFANLAPEDRRLHMGIENICASARDLLKWDEALRSGKIVSKTSYDLMTRPGASSHYGLGFQLSTLEGHRRIYHTGSKLGVSTILSTYPDWDLTIAILANTGEAGTDRLEERIARLLVGLTDLPALKDVILTEAEASRLVGAYQHPRNKLLFKYRDGHLIQTVESLPDDEYAVLWNQGEGVFVYRGSSEYIKFDIANGQMASAIMFGDGATWREPCPRIRAQ